MKAVRLALPLIMLVTIGRVSVQAEGWSWNPFSKPDASDADLAPRSTTIEPGVTRVPLVDGRPLTSPPSLGVSPSPEKPSIWSRMGQSTKRFFSKTGDMITGSQPEAPKGVPRPGYNQWSTEPPGPSREKSSWFRNAFGKNKKSSDTQPLPPEFATPGPALTQP